MADSAATTAGVIKGCHGAPPPSNASIIMPQCGKADPRQGAAGLRARPNQGEERALGIEAMDDPIAAGHLMRAVDDVPTGR